MTSLHGVLRWPLSWPGRACSKEARLGSALGRTETRELVPEADSGSLRAPVAGTRLGLPHLG
jgi:hypothetical protein